MTHWDKKILAVLLEWDYGIRSRGPSIEKRCFVETLRSLVTTVDTLWYDEFLQNTDSLQRVVVNRVKELKPDLVFFIPYRDEFRTDTLDELRRHAETYAWFGDDQWRFDDFTSRYAPHFTHVSTTDPWSIPKYRQLGIEPILTQWAGYLHAAEQEPLLSEEEYEYDVTFVGGANSYRRWFIDRLAGLGVRVACFGAGWPKGRIDNVEMERVFRNSRINLNISNSVSHDIRYIFSSPRTLINYFRSAKRVEQMKARNFEIPLAGGFQLTNYVPGLDRYFAVGSELAVYSTIDECEMQIRHYLDEPEERRAITLRGHSRALAEHTYRHRLEDVLTSILGAGSY